MQAQLVRSNRNPTISAVQKAKAEESAVHQTEVPRNTFAVKQTTKSAEKIVTQKQSLDVVKTLLGACVGSLAFLRCLFPNDCFIKRRIGDDGTEPGTGGNKGIKVTLLRERVSPEADKLVEWLEKGVYQTIKDGYLKALQIGISTDKNHPELVKEAYTFSFSYRSSGLGGVEEFEMHITDLLDRNVTVASAGKSAQQMIRRLLEMTEGLGPLPRMYTVSVVSRSVTMPPLIMSRNPNPNNASSLFKSYARRLQDAWN
jgi:hypothetical protein